MKEIIFVNKIPVDLMIARKNCEIRKIRFTGYSGDESSIEELKRYLLAEKEIVLLLDISSGAYEILDSLEESNLLYKNLDIYVTSSSKLNEDINKAKKDPRTKGYLSYPFNSDELKEITMTDEGKLNQRNSF